ncbi:MAG: family 1 glycosylhydrolase, partial [Candidatus Nanohaloarchaea archaeon]
MRFGAFIAAHHVEGGLDNDWTRHEKQVSEWLAENAESYIGELDAWKELRDRLESPETYESGKAVDHYNFFQKDLEIASEHDLDAVRLSFSWARIEPEEGVFDEEEIEHYHRVLDAMEENGLEPLLTVWHFTQPEWFADKGFWHQDEAVEDFMRFVKKLEEEFGDRVKRWVTINEATTWIWHAYFRTERYNYFPPGDIFSPVKALKAASNMTEAHRRAYYYLKENGAEEVGVSMFVTDWKPLGYSPVNRLIAAAGRKLEYELFLDSIEDKLDFIGVDYYKKWDIGLGSSDEETYICERNNPSSG